MPRTAFLSTGFHVPARVVTNDDLAKIMDTSDEWIMQRSGIKTRYWVDKGDTGVALAREASKKALDKAGLAPADIDCIIYCTCTPDHFEPGNGVFLQRELGLSDIPAVDVRNQCSGFIYGLSIADAWIRTGQYKNILLVGGAPRVGDREPVDETAALIADVDGGNIDEAQLALQKDAVAGLEMIGRAG